MNVINAMIDSECNLVISPSEGFVGEQNAEMIEIDIGPFAQENYDFFVLNFDNGISGGMFPSNIISTAEDTPAYIDNGVIYCPVIASLTASGNLKIQLEAHKTAGDRVTVKKSSIACISFGESLMGQVNAPDNSNPVYERLAQAEGRIADSEGRIASAESRIAGIEKENFGASIDGVKNRVKVLENGAETADRLFENLNKRVNAVEGYEIPQKFDNLGKKIEAIEKELETSDALTEIPVASNDDLGGIKVRNSSEFFVDSNGFLKLSYGGFNMHPLSVMVTVALLNQTGRIETLIADRTEDIESTLYSCSWQIIDNSLEAVVFASFKNGNIVWVNEKFESVTSEIKPNTVYVLKIVDGEMKLREYAGADMRNLILEGI